jgi:peptide-methionine (S)-S-oxide reductase
VLEHLQAQRHDQRPIVTEISPASDFFRAEDYHQRYNEKHRRASCAF